MNRSILEESLKHNVLLISFIRRSRLKGHLRRMICTKSNFILNSFQGRTNLNFRNPKYGPPDFDQARVNVVVAWDILVQDYRLIPCESVSIIDTIPETGFWKYYNDALYPMTSQDKIKFMNGE